MMGGQTNELMDMQYIYAKNDDFPIDFVIFTKALPTDGPTDGHTLL